MVRAAERESIRVRADAEAQVRDVVRAAHSAEIERQQRLAQTCDQILARAGELSSLIEGVRSLSHELRVPALSHELRADAQPGDAGRPSTSEVTTSRPSSSEGAGQAKPELEAAIREVTNPAPPQLDSRLEAARLVAVPMAVAGRSREEVEAHLRSAFDLEDPTPVLDHVFGSPHAGPARVQR